jgi:hypothetical protein
MAGIVQQREGGMSRGTERVGEVLLEETESLIDSPLGWKQASPDPALIQLEKAVIVIRWKLAQRLTNVTKARFAGPGMQWSRAGAIPSFLCAHRDHEQALRGSVAVRLQLAPKLH